jgi:hypothetical protein
MGLPAGRFHDLGEGGALRALEEAKYDRAFAALPGSALLRLCLFRGSGRFGSFLCRGGLLSRLALRRRGRGTSFGSAGLLGIGFGSGANGFGGGGFGIAVHGSISFCGDYRGQNIHHSGDEEKQGNSAELRGLIWIWALTPIP